MWSGPTFQSYYIAIPKLTRELLDEEEARYLLTVDFEDYLDFDRYTGRQTRHSDGGSGVPAALSKNFDKKVGRTVYHLRLIFEIWSAIDHAQDLNHPLDSIQVAKHGFRLRQ